MPAAGLFLYDVKIVATGDIATATVEEIQENIVALSKANFATKYDKAKAAIVAALGAFGSGDNVESQELIDEILASNDAATAYANLTWQATTEDAAAHDAIVRQVGLPSIYDASP